MRVILLIDVWSNIVQDLEKKEVQGRTYLIVGYERKIQYEAEILSLPCDYDVV